jgi:hypothetical protein
MVLLPTPGSPTSTTFFRVNTPQKLDEAIKLIFTPNQRLRFAFYVADVRLQFIQHHRRPFDFCPLKFLSCDFLADLA